MFEREKAVDLTRLELTAMQPPPPEVDDIRTELQAIYRILGELSALSLPGRGRVLLFVNGRELEAMLAARAQAPAQPEEG